MNRDNAKKTYQIVFFGRKVGSPPGTPYDAITEEREGESEMSAIVKLHDDYQVIQVVGCQEVFYRPNKEAQ